MPDPKNNSKLTGDTHPPDIESADLPIEPNTIESAGRTRARAGDYRPTRGTRKAGELKDADAGGPENDADGSDGGAAGAGSDGGGGGDGGGGSGD